MSVLNRFVAALLWLFLLVTIVYVVAVPFHALDQAQASIGQWRETLIVWQDGNPTNFLVAQIAIVLVAVLVFAPLFVAEILTGRRRGVRIRTADGGTAELDTGSIGRRLEWHLDQLAEIITVVPNVKSRGGSVDIRLEIEAAPDVDVSMKTDEVVEVTRDIIEEDMGLKLGKLDVRMSYAPFDPEWV